MKIGAIEYIYLQELLKINPKITVAQATKRLQLLNEHIYKA